MTVNSGANIREVSAALGEPVPHILKILMNLGEMKTVTQSLTDDEIELVATELKREVEIKHADEEELEPEAFEDAPRTSHPARPSSRSWDMSTTARRRSSTRSGSRAVVETEAGGITQHIGAYQVRHNGRLVTFLDTPGHEAFTALRARGAKVTDIAVLVVAADDGVMPQTLESINHARAAEVPIVVAVNKIDKPEANPQRVRQELVTHGLQPEEWGGTTQFADVSAKTAERSRRPRREHPSRRRRRARAEREPEGGGLGTDHREPPRRRSRPRRDDARHARDAPRRRRDRRGRRLGPVRALHDFRGEKMKEAGPGTPVEILGFDKPPGAGEHARVVENERQARHLAGLRGQRLRAEQLARSSKKGVSLEDLFTQMEEGGVRDLNIVLKADVQGSVEAVVGELAKIKHPEVGVNVIHTGIGAITESDVMLASASNAIVVGFNVRPNAEARAQAEREGVDLRTYRVIYQLTEDIQQALVGMLAPERASRRRSARPRYARSSARRGSASSPVAMSRAASSAAMPRCVSCARARSSTRRRSRASAASRTTRARCRRDSSAASCSRASTT